MKQEMVERMSEFTRNNMREAAQGAAQATQSKKPRHDQPKGHEAYLEALRASGARVEVWLSHSIGSLIGRLKATDKFTISLVPDCGEYNGRTLVLYKHAIEAFGPVEKSA